MDKVKLEIEKAKEQLDEISTAVNRETLVLQDLKKEVALLTDELNTTKETLGSSKEELSKIKSDIKAQKEKLGEQEKTTNASIKYLKGEEEALKAQITSLNEKLGQSIAEGEKALEEALKGLKKEIKDSEATLVKVQLSVQKFEDLNTVLKEENKSLAVKNAELIDLDRAISQKKEEVEKLDVLKEEKTQGLFSKINELEASIKEKEDLLVHKEELSKSLDTEINQKIENKNLIESEIASLSSEKDNFIKEKIAFQKQKEDLDNRELFIQEKYQQAGIIYS